ncbi:MarR family winged helix-turn-helix transcriptional regulator [Lentilactobacillus senioris]|uniref:MarR family winged helix-turn-helix transcriptional regulator n=1 Tax=Lentilactobacillus senioris TaxID=931534 RepID=UPI00227E88A5|nr:MarR family winged helix-turn-helix transcriptional regulator [Lentilactobacillus senioris]MCY9806861.1 MarR family winged helix-turn-helix transcriptional regulator [Lentilactobacillus senioris]
MKDTLVVLRSAEKKYQRILLKLTKSVELTISEWQLLIKVIAGIQTQDQLAEASSLDISTLSRQLKSLVAKDMISKTAIGKDKRQLVYQVTEKGSTANQKVEQLYQQLTVDIFNHWTDEEQQLLKILLNRLEQSINRIKI